ncbi:MAG: hypothetical protein U0353_11150 [Sandaracinus sp.]
MVLSLLLTGSSVVSLGGCTNGHTAVVQLQTDLVPGLEFDEVYVQATGLRSRRANLRDDYGRPVQVAEIGGIAAGTNVLVEVSLRRGGTEIVSRRVQHHIQTDTILGVIITRNCLEIACPSPGAPMATECRDGLCVTPDCEEDRSCMSPECVTDSECSSSVACVTPRCALGVCLDTPDATRCRSDEVCSPVSGCVPAAIPDAGAPDAFVAPDASTPPIDAFVPAPSFTLHHLPAAGSAFATLTTHGEVPTDPIEAVFAPEGTGDLVVLTHTELFVLERASLTFLERHPRDAVFPELAGVFLADGYTIGEDLYFAEAGTTHTSWIYRWTHASRAAAHVRTMTAAELGADWHGPLAPPWWEGLAAFRVPNNREGWAAPDPSRSPCAATPIDGYIGILSWDGFGPAALIVSIYDTGCSQFVNQGYYASAVYPPFMLATAPDDGFTIDAMEWADGLWIFTSPR